jgi:hypothetical protein
VWFLVRLCVVDNVLHAGTRFLRARGVPRDPFSTHCPHYLPPTEMTAGTAPARAQCFCGPRLYDLWFRPRLLLGSYDLRSRTLKFSFVLRWFGLSRVIGNTKYLNREFQNTAVLPRSELNNSPRNDSSPGRQYARRIQYTCQARLYRRRDSANEMYDHIEAARLVSKPLDHTSHVTCRDGGMACGHSAGCCCFAGPPPHAPRATPD